MALTTTGVLLYTLGFICHVEGRGCYMAGSHFKQCTLTVTTEGVINDKCYLIR